MQGPFLTLQPNGIFLNCIISMHEQYVVDLFGELIDIWAVYLPSVQCAFAWPQSFAIVVPPSF